MTENTSSIFSIKTYNFKPICLVTIIGGDKSQISKYLALEKVWGVYLSPFRFRGGCQFTGLENQ